MEQFLLTFWRDPLLAYDIISISSGFHCYVHFWLEIEEGLLRTQRLLQAFCVTNARQGCYLPANTRPIKQTSGVVHRKTLQCFLGNSTPGRR